MASNPGRETAGGRLALTFQPSRRAQLIAGIDRQRNIHTGRSGGPSGSPNHYRDNKRVEDLRFNNSGLFGELSWQMTPANLLVFGLRGDRWEARDKRRNISGGLNPTAGKTRKDTLKAGFARYEHEFSGGTAYIGWGRSERAPDFWEISKESAVTLSALDRLRTEKTHQLDIGLSWQSGLWQGFVSAFHGKMEDYILIESQYRKDSRLASVARNIDATAWGGEAGAQYRFAAHWQGVASLAYVRGENNTERRPLGQMPPLEGRLGLDWNSGAYSFGALLRLVARQNRYALNQGNIAGQDLGETGGFGVFSMNGAYRWNKKAHFAFGIDNVFDRTYAEFISKGGEEVLGYESAARVNEPGRVFWVKAQFSLE